MFMPNPNKRIMECVRLFIHTVIDSRVCVCLIFSGADYFENFKNGMEL